MKLLQLNIEGDNHFDKIFPLFEREQPDVICMQEVFEVDLQLFVEKLGMEYRFLIGESVTKENPYRLTPKGNQGIAIFSKFPILKHDSGYYETFREPYDGASAPNSSHRGLLWAEIEIDNQLYRIATTHFTWSTGGSVTDLQRADLYQLLLQTKVLGEHVICGDFNAPRGKEIFDTLARVYTDNVPSDVKTSLDNTIHRAGDQLPDLMVDGLFTTQAYTASNVKVIRGVSDHCAISAEITVTATQ